MNMLKRTLAMVLVLCMLFSVMPVAALADDSVQEPAGASVEITADETDDAALAEVEPDADEPEVEEPKVEEPKVEEPKVEEPKVEEPKVEEPKVEEPKVEEPKVEEPEAEEPKAEEPKAEDTQDKASSDEPVQEQPVEEVINFTLENEAVTLTGNQSFQYRILHLDCGRKYFTADWIKALINEMAAAGYNQLQLAFGNDGLRFLLDDMSVSVNGTTYSSANVTAGVKRGNKNYYDAGDKNELTQDEMDSIITYASSKGIAIVPHMNMPGHMDAILDAIEYVGISDAHFTGYTTSARSLNLNNDAAVAFTKALLQKYVDYFAANGCKFFHIGADEYANDAYNGSMGFPSMGSDLYARFASFVNDCAAIVKAKGMTPRAWNDGIDYGKDTGYNSFDEDFDTAIQVTYWSSGWGAAYTPAPASTLSNDGHAMINTHGDYYYVLGKNDMWTPGNTTEHNASFYTEASNWSNTSFAGSTVSDPIGSMFCIWCDYPGAESETQIAANTRLILRAMAAEMNGGDAYSISTEVVSGGFNENGTLTGGSTTETREWLTVTDPTTTVSVSGYELTRVEVKEVSATAMPTVAGAAKVQAWDITPYVGDVKYTDKGDVRLPVPAEWTPSLVKGFYVENGQAVVVNGTYADGFYTFQMPHFSVGGLMLLDATTQFDKEIELNVGDTHEIVIKDVNYHGEYATNPTGIATVVAEYKAGEGSSETPVTSVNAGESYYLKNDAGQYMKADATFTGDISEAEKWTLVTSTNGYMIHNGNNQYLFYEDGWILFDGWGDDFKFVNGKLVDYYVATQSLIPVAGGGTVDQSTITFTGVAPGTTYSTVGNTTYKIVVHGSVNIIIKYQTANGTVIKTETVTVADNATAYTVSNFTHTDGKYYVVDNTTLNITPATVTDYTVIVTETEEDLTQVASLSIEYWLTNAHVVESQGSNVRSKSVTAVSAYSESGIDVSTIIPSSGRKFDAQSSDPDLVYWHTRLLPLPENEQTDDEGDDETLNGISFTKVRYWSGSWAVYTDAGEWQNITLTEYQLVAYYMNDLRLADEVRVNTADWGKKGNGEFASGYLGSNHVSLAFQIVYEDGTTAPVDTMAASLAPYTYFVDAWGNRGVGTIGINQIGDYQIWKVTAETGEHSTTWTGNYDQIYFNSVHWDGNEMTVWEDAENPVSQYTIQNPANNPNTNGYYDNLRWNEYNESILIRIYIKAEETEDSLKVVYYDEKFGDTLVEYNVIVPAGSNFNNGIVEAGTQTLATLPEFSGNASRKDATGYGIVNALDKTQNFRTDLTQVPEAVGKYRNELYTYTGSEVSADGKTITHFYTINTEILSPNFIVDFGLPLTFGLDYLLGEGTVDTDVISVDNLTARYGTVVYDETNKVFIYTPNKVLKNIDVLTITMTMKGLTEGSRVTSTTNVGVTPATTVYYEENFLTYDANWSAPTAANKKQTTEVLGDLSAQAGRTRNNYGYDPAYVHDASGSNGTNVFTTTNGATASFTFTGTGFALYANCNDGTGYVTLTREGETKKMYMMDTGLNYADLKVDMPGATEIPSGYFYNIPVIAEKNLPYGEYTVTIRKTHNDDQKLEIDGFRVYETIDESQKTNEESFYRADKEDKPVFYELRDLVLKAIGGIDATGSQVYNDLGVLTGIISDARVPYANSSNVDALLNHGPKNEIYLYKDQTLTFKVKTDRVMQIGLKAPNGATTYDLTCDNGGESKTGVSMKSSVDMFYHVGNPTGAEKEFTVQVKNLGDKVLAVTELKVCDDPNFAFLPLTEADISGILKEETEPEAPSFTLVELKGTDVTIDGTEFQYTGKAIEPAVTVTVDGNQLVEGKDYSVTYTNNVEPGTATVTVRGIATASETLGYTGEVSINYTITAPVTPEEPEIPEETTKPTEPEAPTEPEKPGKPEKPEKPGQSKATAELKIELVDYTGKKIATAKLTEKGTSGDTCYFKSQEILKAAKSKLSGMYAIVDESAISGVETVYGESSTITVQVGKVATLKITFINLRGKKVGTATLTKVQTDNSRCTFQASEIRQACPAGRRVLSANNVRGTYGKTASTMVIVF